MKSIVLKSHEVIHLRDTGSVIAWRVVKPSWIAAAQATGESNGPETDGKYWVEICPHGRTGEERWVKETWMEGHAYDDDGHGKAYHKACWGNVPEDLKWRSPVHMPRWASRFTVTLDVGLKRIQEVTGDEAVSSGLEKVEVGTRFETWKNYEFKTAHPKHGSVITDIEHRISGFSSPVRSLQSLANHSNPGSWDRNDYFWKITCTLTK